MKITFENSCRIHWTLLVLIIHSAFWNVSCERRNLLDDVKTMFNTESTSLLALGQALVFNDNLSSECTTSLLRTGKALQSGKMWAIKMLTASGVVPENLFLGQTQAHGSLEQCINRPLIEEETDEDETKLKSQYCKVRVSFDSNTTSFKNLAEEIHRSSGLSVMKIPKSIKGIYTGVVISLCLPEDCNRDDLTLILRTVEDMYGVAGELNTCQNGNQPPLELKQKCVLALLLCILIISLIGLFVDLRHFIFKKTFAGRLLRCFALNANWSSLFEPGNRESRTGFLNGIKLLLCLWISAGHLIIFPSPEFTQNPGAFYNVISRSLWFQLFSNINLAVVGFFFISGFLIHSGTKRFSTENPLKYIIVSFVRRYVKLVIPAMIVLLTTFLYPLFSSTASPEGGFYYNNVGRCGEEWYLLVCLWNNYIDLFREQCLTHLWYIATDLKIFPVVVGLSVLYRKHPKYANIFSLSLVLVTSIAVGIETFVEGASGVVARADLEGNRYVAAGMALDIYTRPYTQIAAYILGLLCAIAVEDDRSPLSKLTNLSKWILWTLTLCLFLTQAVFLTYSSIQVFSPAGIAMSVYSGLSRPIHALIYMWIVTACTLRLAEPLRLALSHPIMHVLGKLSYGVYLIHFPLASLTYANLKNASLQYNLIILSQNVFGTLTQSFILAVILFVLVEKPIANLDKLFVNRQTRPAVTNPAVAATSLPAVSSQFNQAEGQLPTHSKASDGAAATSVM